jgi:hypothetical protein
VEEKKAAATAALLKVMTLGFGKALAEVSLDENHGDAEAAVLWLRDPANLLNAEAKAEMRKLTEASLGAEPLYSGIAGLSPQQIEVAENLFRACSSREISFLTSIFQQLATFSLRSQSISTSA